MNGLQSTKFLHRIRYLYLMPGSKSHAWKWSLGSSNFPEKMFPSLYIYSNDFQNLTSFNSREWSLGSIDNCICWISYASIGAPSVSGFVHLTNMEDVVVSLANHGIFGGTKGFAGYVSTEALSSLHGLHPTAFIALTRYLYIKPGFNPFVLR